LSRLWQRLRSRFVRPSGNSNGDQT
jgi:hypothetical protein